MKAEERTDGKTRVTGLLSLVKTFVICRDGKHVISGILKAGGGLMGFGMDYCDCPALKGGDCAVDVVCDDPEALAAFTYMREASTVAVDAYVASIKANDPNAGNGPRRFTDVES